jgi:hypothetical protein
LKQSFWTRTEKDLLLQIAAPTDGAKGVAAVQAEERDAGAGVDGAVAQPRVHPMGAGAGVEGPEEAASDGCPALEKGNPAGPAAAEKPVRGPAVVGQHQRAHRRPALGRQCRAQAPAGPSESLVQRLPNRHFAQHLFLFSIEDLFQIIGLTKWPVRYSSGSWEWPVVARLLLIECSKSKPMSIYYLASTNLLKYVFHSIRTESEGIRREQPQLTTGYSFDLQF